MYFTLLHYGQTEQGGTQSERGRTVAAEPLGEPSLSPFRLHTTNG